MQELSYPKRNDQSKSFHLNSIVDPSVTTALATAAQAAHSALASTRPACDAFLKTLNSFEASIKSLGFETKSTIPETMRESFEAFKNQYDALCNRLDGLAEKTGRHLSDAFANAERDADFVTIMLFGRTRAGKSTTMEALTGGDGTTIGIGSQHTTKEIRLC